MSATVQALLRKYGEPEATVRGAESKADAVIIVCLGKKVYVYEHDEWYWHRDNVEGDGDKTDSLLHAFFVC